jgi:hypothetical protein
MEGISGGGDAASRMAGSLDQLQRLYSISRTSGAPVQYASRRLYLGGPGTDVYTVPDMNVVQLSFFHVANTGATAVFSMDVTDPTGTFTVWSDEVVAARSKEKVPFPIVLFPGESISLAGTGSEWGIYALLLQEE